MSEHPKFMSYEHIDALNRRLSNEKSVMALCASLERDLILLYENSDGPDGAKVYWRTDLTRSGGVRFSLEKGTEPPDVVIVGCYWDIIDAMQGKSVMPRPQGQADDIARIISLLSSNEVKECAVPVTWPMRAAT